MDNVRSGVAGTSVKPASTKEAEELQAKLPKKVVKTEEKTVFEGAGTFFLAIGEDKPNVEVRFKKSEGGRFSTSDGDLIKVLKDRGFRLIPKEQLLAEREEAFKLARSKRTTNATMQDYVSCKIAELKDELSFLSGGDTDDGMLAKRISGLSELVEKEIQSIRTMVINNKKAVDRRFERLKEKRDGDK